MMEDAARTLRPHLRSVAYRMLGSLSEADDAVQEAWLRLGRADANEIANLGGWMTTVVARVCLDMLRARARAVARVPDPIITLDEDDELDEPVDPVDPAHELGLADSISLALLVVLETLAPPERFAFVLHDLFDVPFDEIAPIVGKSPAAARQLASRARRRVQGVPPPDADARAHREIVSAFMTAARTGDLDALLRLLDPDVVVRAATVSRGAASAAQGAIKGGALTASLQRVRVNGAPGYISFTAAGEPRAIVAFTIHGGKVTEINVLADPDQLSRVTWSHSGEPIRQAIQGERR